MENLIHPTAQISPNCKLGPGLTIEDSVYIGQGTRVGANCLIYQGTYIGPDSIIQPNCILGLPVQGVTRGCHIGSRAVIRAGSIIYAGVTAGDDLRTGHYTVIRERTLLGNRVLVGTNAVIDGDAVLGDGVSLQTGVYITRYTTVGDRVFFGPFAKTTNDRYMQSGNDLIGPTIEKHSRIGCGAILLPGVTIGTGAVVGAGAVVTANVDPYTTVAGVPARYLRGKGVDF
ncbi:MAG: DapH/DapD/GlmU-related protein [Bacillota bacterium]